MNKNKYKVQKEKGGWLKYYFIIAYILTISVFGQVIYDIYQTPSEDKWESSECLEVNNPMFLNTECEKHISLNQANKLIFITLMVFVMLVFPLGLLVFPLGLLIVFAIITGGITNE